MDTTRILHDIRSQLARIDDKLTEAQREVDRLEAERDRLEADRRDVHEFLTFKGRPIPPDGDPRRGPPS